VRTHSLGQQQWRLADHEWAAGKLTLVGFANGVGAVTPGRLTMGPMGLGMLLTGNYLSDARTLYCASSDGLCDRQPVAGAYGKRLTDWQKAGGFDGRTLTHGVWTGHNWGDWPAVYHTDDHRAVVSHYSYRNVQVVDAQCGGALTTLAGYDVDRLTPVPWARPLLRTENLAPSFKTVKLQGGRAIASDTFNKLWDQQNAAGTTFAAGVGDQAHREGYNVLYGDNHVQWHGDPQRKIIWWSVWYLDGYSLDRMNTSWEDNRRRKQSAFHVWHDLDVAGGVDVGTTD